MLVRRREEDKTVCRVYTRVLCVCVCVCVLCVCVIVYDGVWMGWVGGGPGGERTLWGLGRRPGRGTLQRGDVSFCLQNLLLRAVESVSLLLDSAVLAERGQSPSPAAASPEPQPSPFFNGNNQREVANFNLPGKESKTAAK